VVVGVESCTKINTGFSVGRRVLSGYRKERGQPLNCRSQPGFLEDLNIRGPHGNV